MAEHTLEVFGAEPGPVVIPSGSCAAMIRHGYQELFAKDAKWLPRAVALAERTYEFTEYLVDVIGVTDVGARFRKPLTYHASCHLLHDLGVVQQPRLLLENVEGVEFRELPEAEDCCGFGGVFSVNHPEISSAMLDRKIEKAASTQAHTLVTCDTGCMMHIAGGLKRRNLALQVRHISEILAQT
jgi:L-lactate dehydrogenase complex protein LldE